MPIFPMMEYIRGQLMKCYQERSEKRWKETTLVVQSIVNQIQVSIQIVRAVTVFTSLRILLGDYFAIDANGRDSMHIHYRRVDCRHWQATGVPLKGDVFLEHSLNLCIQKQTGGDKYLTIFSLMHYYYQTTTSTKY